MSKLRESTITSTATIAPSSSTTSLTVHSQTRRAPSAMALDTRSISSTRNMNKSCSTQNLVLPTTIMQQSKIATLRRVKLSRMARRPPNLPTVSNVQSSSISSTSSSTSSSASSPTKTSQTKENHEIKQYLPPSSSFSMQESILPLRELDNTTNDHMPKWAQDCFYRTVVLGLKPLLLQDMSSSPNKPTQRSSSTCSVESSDSLEATSDLQACTLNDTNNNNRKEIQVRRSISISDYRNINQANKISSPSLSETAIDDSKQE